MLIDQELQIFFFFFSLKVWPLTIIFQGHKKHNFEFANAVEDALQVLSFAAA